MAWEWESESRENERRRSQADLIKAPKRKVCLLLAFCGKNYYGLQLNRGDTTLPTIEGALFNALVQAKVVPDICLEKSQQMKYSSSSRTDKGVSSCGLPVALKLRACDDVVDLINGNLPADIRVLALKRVTKSFHAKNQADARTYSYTMPTYAFDVDVKDKSSYRLSEARLNEVKRILNKYKGTHSFHNFTSGKRLGEASAKRYIIDFWAESPFVHESLEFITLKVKGQSFMIHQIRKMVGLLIAMASGRSSDDHLERAFTEPFEDIPKAPGNGLILEQVHYQAYNKKNGHLHGDLEWDSCADKAKEFMTSKILPTLYKYVNDVFLTDAYYKECHFSEEIECNSMAKWLEGMGNHDFSGIRPKEQWSEQALERQKKNDERDICNDRVDPTKTESHSEAGSLGNDTPHEHDTSKCVASTKRENGCNADTIVDATPLKKPKLE